MRIFSRIWLGISEDELRWRIVDSGRNTYEMRFEVRCSGGVSLNALSSSERRFKVVGIEAGVKRDAPKSGTHMALSCKRRFEYELREHVKNQVPS